MGEGARNLEKERDKDDDDDVDDDQGLNSLINKMEFLGIDGYH